MKKINVPELKIAGKTGTAEYPGPKDAKGIMPTHGWFTAFAPYDNPQVSVTVFVQRGGGPTNAAPIAMKIFKRYFNYVRAGPRARGHQVKGAGQGDAAQALALRGFPPVHRAVRYPRLRAGDGLQRHLSLRGTARLLPSAPTL